MRLRNRNSATEDDQDVKNKEVTNSDSNETSDEESDAEMEALAKMSCKNLMKKPPLSPILDQAVPADRDTDSDEDEEDIDGENDNNIIIDSTTKDSVDDTPSSLKHDKGLVSSDSEDDTTTGFVIDRTSNAVTEKSKSGKESKKKSSSKSRRLRKMNSKKKKKQKNKEAIDPMALSSSLQVGFDTSDVYVNVHTDKQPTRAKELNSIISGSSEIEKFMKKSVITSDFEKQHTILPYEESLNQIKKQRRKERGETKGRGWHNMKAKEMTESDKNDLTVLQMRRVLDPKRFYKGNDLKALPKFYQMGKVVDSPLEFYSNRIPKKERKQTLVDELLADAEFRTFNKRKYAEIVESKAQGRGAYKHMKRLKKRKR